MEDIFKLIFEYFDLPLESKKKQVLEYKNNILKLAIDYINISNKENTILLIKKIFILLQTKIEDKEQLLIRILPEILSNCEGYYEEIASIIYDSKFGDDFLKLYKKAEKTQNIEIENNLDLYCSYNYLLEVLKRINERYSIYNNLKKAKKLDNTQNRYDKVLSCILVNNIFDLESIYGLSFYKSRLKRDIHLLLQSSDYEFIRIYYKKIYANLIKQDYNLINQMMNEDLFIYIMQSNRDSAFILEMQQYFENTYKNHFIALNNKLVEYNKKFKDGNFSNFEDYFHIYNLTGNYIDDTLANYILYLSFQDTKEVSEESVIAAIRSLGKKYLTTLGIGDYSFIVKNSSDMNLKRGNQQEHPTKVITINKSSIYLLLKYKKIILFKSLFHELEHAKKSLKQRSYFEYQMQKEEIVIQYIPYYYLQNYQFFLSEIDARLNGTICTFQYLEQLIPDKVEAYKEELIKELKAENELLNNFNKPLKPDAIYTFGEEIDSIFSDIVLKKPSIIRRNPLFQIEYYLDGNLKEDFQLLLEYDKLDMREKGFVKEILQSRCQVDISGLLYKLKSFFETFGSIKTEIQKYYVEIICNCVLTNIQSENLNDVDHILNYLYPMNSNLVVSNLIMRIYDLQREKLRK